MKNMESHTIKDVESVIRIENIQKKYNKIVGLNGISLNVERGSCVGFLGPNGAGKSTTIKILTGLIRPTGGKAYLNGHDITKNKKLALESVGCLVETPDFYPYLTPIDTLNYLGDLRGVDGLEQRIEDILKLVKLGEWADTRIGSFSKGMKQRLGIGQALLHDPNLIILDEPTSGLDPKGMAEVRDIILKLKKDKTLFISSHMLSEMQQTADKVALINRGEILAYDSIDALSQKYFTVKEVTIETIKPLTDELIEKIKRYRKECNGGATEVKNVTKTGERSYNIYFTGETEECRKGLLKWMVEEDIGIIAFNPKGLALENIYMERIK